MPMHGRQSLGPVIESHYHVAPCSILLPHSCDPKQGTWLWYIIVKRCVKVPAVRRSEQEVRRGAELHVNGESETKEMQPSDDTWPRVLRETSGSVTSKLAAKGG